MRKRRSGGAGNWRSPRVLVIAAAAAPFVPRLFRFLRHCSLCGAAGHCGMCALVVCASMPPMRRWFRGSKVFSLCVRVFFLFVVRPDRTS